MMKDQLKEVFDRLCEMPEHCTIVIYGVAVERFITGYSVDGSSYLRAQAAAAKVLQLSEGKEQSP